MCVLQQLRVHAEHCIHDGHLASATDSLPGCNSCCCVSQQKLNVHDKLLPLPCSCCSFNAFLTTANRRLALVVIVLQLQVDPLGQVFTVDTIQLHGFGCKKLRYGCWYDHCGQPPADVRGKMQLLVCATLSDHTGHFKRFAL
jgi:hypothetical protein